MKFHLLFIVFILFNVTSFGQLANNHINVVDELASFIRKMDTVQSSYKPYLFTIDFAVPDSNSSCQAMNIDYYLNRADLNFTNLYDSFFIFDNRMILVNSNQIPNSFQFPKLYLVFRGICDNYFKYENYVKFKYRYKYYIVTCNSKVNRVISRNCETGDCDNFENFLYEKIGR